MGADKLPAAHVAARGAAPAARAATDMKADLALQQQAAAREDPNVIVPFRRLFAYADSLDVVLIGLGSFGALLAGAPLPIAAYLFGTIVDDAHAAAAANIGDFRAAQLKTMSQAALHALITGLIAACAYFLQVACWMSVGERQAERIRYRYLQALLRQDLSFYDEEVTAGAAVESITVDTLHIKQATGDKVGKLLQILGTLLSGYTIAFIQGWKLTFLATVGIPFIIISGFIMDLAVSKVSKDVFDATGEAGCIVEQVVTAIKTVMPFGGERKAVHAYDKALRKASRACLQASIATGIGVGTIMFFTYGVYAFTLWFGAKFITHGGYTGGRVMSVLFSIMIGTGTLGQCMPSLTAISSGRAAAHKMFHVINRVPSIDLAEQGSLVLKGMRGDIELQNVRFAYPTRREEEVLKDFCLSVPARTRAALVGESGSGKSTVVSLIERFYDPLSGQVTIDGIDLRRLNLSWFRQHVGLVAQEPVLLRGSIRDNIAYGSQLQDNVPEQDIHTAAQLANAAHFISRLPLGMDTIVGQGGLQLSGGQKQRIAIARALLKDPTILLLDEATSALDVESEALVHSALETAMQGRTTLIIAHRLATVKDAHFIALVQHGRIIEQGTHAELLSKPDGAFAQLVQLEERRNEEQEHDSQQNAEASDSSSTAIRSHGRAGSGPKRPSRKNLSFGSIGSLKSSQYEPIADEFTDSITVTSSVGCSHILRLAAFNKPETPLLLTGSLAAVCNGAIFPIVGILFTNILHTFFQPRDKVRAGATLWIYFFVALAGFSLLITPLQNVCFFVAGDRLVCRIRLLTFNKVLHQDIKWFEQSENASGLISSRLQHGASQMRLVVGDGVSTIVQNVTTIVVGLFIAMSTCWQLALLFIGLLPFYSLDACMQMKLGEAFDAKAKITYEEMSQITHEALSSIRTVASFCAEKKILSVYRAKSLDCLRGGRRRALIAGLGFGATYVMMFGSFALSFWAGGELIYNGQVDFSRFVKTFLTVELSACAVAISLGVAPDVSNVKTAMASVFKMLDLRQNDLNAGTKLKRLRGEVEFQDVEFTYPMRPDTRIFSNLTFTLEAGKTLALVGESGCGKSTVLALVQRFYDPEAGKVCLDKVDIRQLQIRWLRRQMGLVSQEPFLFNDTIRANIEYGVEGQVTEEALQNAAEVANANKFIAGLPMGYDTLVGERGVQLSGGQKQRVAIARAMVRDPKILLLDEATSALDAEAELVVQVALERAAAGRSTMVVAHRLSTVKNADLIIVLKDGHVAEQGTHDHLMTMESGIYAALVKISTSTYIHEFSQLAISID